jgi:hypothetical protein
MSMLGKISVGVRITLKGPMSSRARDHLASADGDKLHP